MPMRSAEAEWTGGIKDGSGRMKSDSGAIDGPYSFVSRFESGDGTNPEELIGAAHAGCYSMALSAALGRAGFDPARIHTVAKVHLETGDEGPAITKVELLTEAEVPDIDEETFREHAEGAKKNCPVSKALAGVEITLQAQLTTEA